MSNVENFLMPMIIKEVTRSRHPSSPRSPSLYPSSASAKTPTGEVLGGCWRADWYRINGAPASDSSEFYMHMTWALGKSIENEVVDAMKKAGIYESNATRFYIHKYNISGELDIVGRYRPTPDTIGYYLVEVKSVYGYGATATVTGRAKAYKGQPAFAPYPKESNIMQVMIYIDHFDGSRDGIGKLDFAKLLYIPRDKPNSGREYTISLVTSEDLSEAFKEKYGSQMKPNHRYAMVQTPDFPDVVETRFSIEDIYDRYDELKKALASGDIPDRQFKKFYSEEDIELMRENGSLSATQYEAWDKAGRPKANLEKTPGHFLCQSYCDWRTFCYKKDGSPNLEADKVPSLIKIDEPRSNHEC